MQLEPILFEGKGLSTKYTPDLLLHTWTSGAVTMCETSEAPADGLINCAWAFEDFGEHTITVTITDPDSEFATDTIVIDIIENNPPTIVIEDPIADEVYDFETPIFVKAIVDDQEDASDLLKLTLKNTYVDEDGISVEEEVTDLDTTPPPYTAGNDGNFQGTTSQLKAGVNELTFTVTDTLGSYASETLLITLNTPPLSPIITLEPNPAITADALTTVIVQESDDPDGDTVSYQYVWYIDGVDQQQPLSKNTMDANIIQRDQTVKVSVTPYDTHGSYGTEVSAELVVSNALPSLSSCEIQDSAPTSADDLVVVAGGWSDIENDPESYTYDWMTEENGTWVSTGVTNSTYPASETTRDDKFKVLCTAVDAFGPGDSLESSSVTIDNTLPSFTECTLLPGNPKTTSDLAATPAGLQDMDGDPVTFQYIWKVDGAVQGSTTDTLSSNATARDNTVEVECIPNDGYADGISLFDSTTITNSKPDAPDLSVSPSDPLTNDRFDVNIDTESTDADGDSVSYTYEFIKDGTSYQGPGSKAFIANNIGFRDEYWEVIVTPNDGTSNGSNETLAVTIGNAPPSLSTCEIIEINPSIDEDLTALGGGFTDPEGDPASYTYQWYIDSGDGQGWLASDATESLSSANLEVGYQVKVDCTSNDGDLNSNTVSSATLTLENTVPSITDCLLLGTGANVNKPVTGDDLHATASGFYDPNGDPEQYRYEWHVNGVYDASATSDTYPSSNTSKGEEIIVQCIPYDDIAGDGAALSSGALTIHNTAPPTPSISILPISPLTDDVLSVSVDVQDPDPDGDTISYTYVWTPNAAITPMIGAGSTAKGDYWTVTVTPCDDDPTDPLCGSESTPTGATIENSLPTITDCNINPASPTGIDDLNANFSGWVDADNDTSDVSFEWYEFDGVDWVSVASSGSVFAASQTTSGLEYKVVCTPRNGSDLGPALESSPVTIQNGPPSLTGCQIDPANPTTTDTLTAIPSGWSDPEGDAPGYQYVWYVDGSISTAANGSTLDSTVFERDDQIQVDCIPDDGLNQGAPVSSSVLVIGNSPPGAPVVDISPSTPTVDDDLQSSVTTDSDDADADIITYSYTWYRNGSVFVGLTDAFVPAVYTYLDDVWTVLVTPNDAIDDGTIGQVTVIVGNSPPSINSCDLSPTNPSSSDDITASAGGWYDADGDAESILYEWERSDGLNWLSAGTGSQLDYASTARDEEWRAVCTPINGAGSSTVAGTPVVSASVTIENSVPNITGCSIGPLNPSTTDDLVATLAGWADEDGDSANASYVWYVNGVPDGSITTATFPAGNTDRDDQLHVSCTANDGLEDGNSVTSNTLTVTNTSPSITSCDLDNYTPLTTQTLNASVGGWLDPDGDNESVQYKWFVNSVEDTGSTTAIYPSSNYVKGDIISVKCTPVDPFAAGSAFSSGDAVVQNTSPTITGCEITTTAASFETATDLIASVTGWSDDDNDTESAQFAWTINSMAAGTGATLSASSFVKHDVIELTCTADDGDDLGNTEISSAVTIPNTAPTIGTCQLSPVSPSTTDDINANFAGWNDADGDSPSATYLWYVNGTPELSVSGSVFPGSMTDSLDSITIDCTADDGEDLGNTVSSAPVTIGNSAPSITGCSLNDLSPTTLDDIVVTLQGWSDDDGDPEGALYAWFVNQVFDPTIVTNTYPDHLTSKDDDIYVTCTPYDGLSGGTAVDSSTATVANSAPSLTGCTAVSTTGTLGTEHDLTAQLNGWFDEDGDSEGATYQWYVNTGTAGTTAVQSHMDFVKGDEVSVHCTPWDGDAPAGNVVISPPVMIPNTGPTASNVIITPAVDGAVGDTLTCAFDYDDVDNDSTQSTFAWTVSSVNIGNSVTLSSGFVGGEEVVCTVTPNDGTANGPTGSASFTIPNTAPTVSNVVLAPDPAAYGDTIYCGYDYSDPDDPSGSNDASTYSWMIDGLPAGVDDAPLTGGFTGPDVVTCTVTATDGTTQGNTDTGTLTISNTAPTVTDLAISCSSSCVAGDTLTCNYNYDDVDQDSDQSTFAWAVDGAPLSGQTTSQLSTGFVGGDQVTCSVTPYDGMDSNPPVTSQSLSINNTNPTVSDLLISPTPAYFGTDLSCTYTFDDADGDQDNSQITWEVDNTQVATGASLTANIFIGGQSVSCNVTPNDGVGGTGLTMSDSIFITNTLPSVSAVTITPIGPHTDDDLLCTYDYADADGNDDASNIVWTVSNSQGGQGTPAGTSANLAASNFEREQWIQCAVTANDGIENGNLVSVEVQILNSVPTVSNASVLPNNPTANTTSLACDYTFSDIDTIDNDASTVKWFKNATEVHNQPTYTGPFVGGDQLYCVVTASDGTATGNTVNSSTVTVGNTPPVISNVTIDQPAAVYGTDLSCSYDYEDDDLNPDNSTITWTVGSVQVGTGPNLTTNSFSGGETVTCTVTAEDSVGTIGNTDSDFLFVGNTAPTVAATAITPTSPDTDDELSCGYTYNDVDNDSDLSTYSWTVAASPGGQGVTVGTGQTLSGDNFSRDEWVMCTVTAYDGDDYGNSVADEVEIRNTAPSVSAISISNSSINNATSSISCDYTYTDLDTDPDSSNVTWYEMDSLVYTGSSYSGPFLGGDQLHCEVEAYDGTVSGNTIDSSVVVVGNTIPEVQNVQINESNIVYGTDLSCSYNFIDPDLNGDNSTYAWKVNNSTEGTDPTFTANSFVQGDTVTCEITPNDGVGGIGTPVADSVIVGNTKPTVTDVAIDPSVAVTTTELTCDYTYDDVDNQADQSTIVWTVAANQGGNGVVAGNGSTLDATAFSRDEWVKCAVTSNDGLEDGTTDSNEIQIQNTPPTVTNTAVSPTTISAGTTTLTCDYVYDDDDNDNDLSNYSWYLNNALLGSSVTFTRAFIGGDTIYCMVQADDGTTTGNTDTAPTITVGNSPPVVDVTAITPANPTTGTLLTCAASASDPDGGTPSIAYTWFVGSVNMQSGPSNQFSGNFDYQDFVTCGAIAYDGTSYSATDTLTIQIANASPSITSVTATATTSPANVTSTYTATFNGYSDPDTHAEGGSLYQWHVNGAPVTGQTSATMGAGHAVRGDDVTVIITPCDYIGACGSPVTSNIIDLLNASPEAPTVSIDPAVAETDHDLTCVSASGTDPDGDPTTTDYEWELQGGSATASTKVLPASQTVLGETWQCRARAVDNQADAYSAGPWSAIATRTIEDITDPPAPTLLAPDPYTNDTTIDIQGQGCEVGNTCNLNCTDNSGTAYGDSGNSCTSGASTDYFNATISGIPRGETVDCSAVCTDPSGNSSAESNMVSSEVCSTVDPYEDDIGAGDSSSNPIDVWTAFDDTPASSTSFSGTLLKESGTWDADYYVIDTSDTLNTSTWADTHNPYNFRVDLTASAGSLYTVQVYRGGTLSTDLECSTTIGGYTEYNDCAHDFGNSNTYHLGTGGSLCRFQSAYPTTRYNNCDDLSNSYVIKIIRDASQPESCDSYTVNVSNGATQTGTDICEN